MWMTTSGVRSRTVVATKTVVTALPLAYSLTERATIR